MRGASRRDDGSTISVGRSSKHSRRLPVEGGGSSRHGLTHHLFRFPAKFHPPVVRALLDAFSEEGDVVFDPFCGSGTALVEAAALGRVAVGLDIDPVAIAITHAKTARYDKNQIARRADLLLGQLTEFDRGRSTYEGLASKDLTPRTFARELRDDDLWVPEIPNLGHWFRRYVVVDLARIRSAILGLRMSQRTLAARDASPHRPLGPAST